MFPTICEIVFRPEKYKEEIIYKKPTWWRKPLPNILTAFIAGSDVEHNYFFINAFTCSVTTPGIFETTKKYRIAAGPKTDSVIALREIIIYNDTQEDTQEVPESSNVNQQIVTNNDKTRHEITDYVVNVNTGITNYKTLPYHLFYEIVEYIEHLSIEYLTFYHNKLY